MLFQNSEITNNAIQVVSLLAPAFAAGFAVQRLLEILDSWFDLDTRMDIKWKKALLSSISLVVGIFLAYRLELRVVGALSGSLLGANISAGLDYLVSGLIISAGTEGLNSILKFLSYSKEVKKAEILTEKETAISTRGLRQLSLFSAISTLDASNNEFQKTGDLSADLESSLRYEIKATWNDKFNEAEWKKTPFSSYTFEAGDGKEVVLDATLVVAQAYNRIISKDARRGLQALVTLETTPEKIAPNMRNAILFGYL
jgi:hypothetical protein